MTEKTLKPLLIAAPLAALALAACDRPVDRDTEPAEPAEEIAIDPLSRGEDVMTDDGNREAEVLMLGGEPAPGVWFFDGDIAEDFGPRAAYGQPRTDGLFAVACNGRTGQVILSRAGTISPGREVPMRIVTDSETLALTARSSIGDLPMIEARIAPGSETADALADIGSSFAVIVESTDPILLAAPGNQVTRVIESCRERS